MTFLITLWRSSHKVLDLIVEPGGQQFKNSYLNRSTSHINTVWFNLLPPQPLVLKLFLFLPPSLGVPSSLSTLPSFLPSCLCAVFCSSVRGRDCFVCCYFLLVEKRQWVKVRWWGLFERLEVEKERQLQRQALPDSRQDVKTSQTPQFMLFPTSKG